MLLMKLTANWTFICSLRDLECLLEGHSLSPEIKTGKDWERRRLTKKFITQCVHFVLSPVMRCFYFFSYHYKLPFDVYAHTFDMCTN